MLLVMGSVVFRTLEFSVVVHDVSSSVVFDDVFCMPEHEVANKLVHNNIGNSILLNFINYPLRLIAFVNSAVDLI